MSVLVDTSVWVEHFRRADDRLQRLLAAAEVVTHPMVIGELACGTPPAPRADTLASLRLLPSSQQANMDEVVDFAERERLYGLGCGLVDLTLLASTLLTPGAALWTLDRRLSGLARRFAVSHLARLH